MTPRKALALAVLAPLLTTCATTGPPSRSITVGSGVPGPDASERSTPVFPGGGQILFRPKEGPGYDREGVGIASADGTVRTYPASDQSSALWDPARDGDILLVSYDERSRAEAFTPTGDGLLPVDSWRIDDGSFVAFSPDGRWLAETPFDRRGHLRTGTIRLVDRVTGEGRLLRLGGELTLWAFSPDGDLVAAPWNSGTPVLLNPMTGEVTGRLPLPGAGVVSEMLVWSPDGAAVAASVCCESSRIVVADASGELIAAVSLGHRNVSIPTWSPDGTRVAVITRSFERGGHRRADLIVLDLQSGTTLVVDSRVSDAFWASWSPDGRWLLVDDWARDRWLFVAADGGERLPYTRLGDMPRWCCQSSPPVSVRDPVC